MTRGEFETWLTGHYGDLLAVARRLVRTDAEDVVQQTVAMVLANQDLSKVRAPWTWFLNSLRGVAGNNRRSATRKMGENYPDSIRSEDSKRPGASPDQIRRHVRLSPQQRVDRRVYRNYLRQLEENRRLDMEGYYEIEKTRPEAV